MLLHRFGKCNVSVKLCLFKLDELIFVAGSVAKVQYHCVKKVQSCIHKMCFGCDSITAMLFELGLATLDTGFTQFQKSVYSYSLNA